MSFLSVIVPTHRRPERAAKLVREILGQKNAPANEIVVVSNVRDNVLKASIVALAGSYPPGAVVYHEAGAIGVNRARNVGMDVARGDIFLFLDDDCRLGDDGFLKRVGALHGVDFPDAAAVGGPYLLPENASEISRVYHALALHWFLGGTRFTQSCRLLGGAVSYKSAKLGKHRFDTRIAFGAAEVEFHLRLQQAGLVMVADPRHAVTHDPDLDLANFLRKRFLQGRAAASFLREFRRPMQSPLAVTDVLDWFSLVEAPTSAARQRLLLRVANAAFVAGQSCAGAESLGRVAMIRRCLAAFFHLRSANLAGSQSPEPILTAVRALHRLASEKEAYGFSY